MEPIEHKGSYSVNGCVIWCNRRIAFLIVGCVLGLVMTGCATRQDVSGPSEMRAPWRGARVSLSRGMVAEEVTTAWGPPDAVRVMGYDAQGVATEEWVYCARWERMPWDMNYLSEDKYLVFDGKSLTHIGSTSTFTNSDQAAEPHP